MIVLIHLSFLTLASLNAQPKVEQWERFEITLHHSPAGNGFTDVEISTAFTNGDTSISVPGFYDGGDSFVIRFMPASVGKWSYRTSSNIPDLDNKTGAFECVAASSGNHGMVKVMGESSFKYSDGKNYYPFGTTAYAWIHMNDELQETTLKTLSKSGFNKIRMCVFPKNYDLVKTEPLIYPFKIKEVIKDDDGNEIKVWDFERFNPEFFRHLEKRIVDLNNLGIEADLILFHPYDKGRWGFDSMPMDVNIRYLKYITARLSSFRNVWWSLANEWDLVKARSHSDWDTLLKVVTDTDPFHHLCSIHGTTAKYFEYWKPGITHLSVQDEGPVMHPGAAAILRNAMHKPVIYDEVGYEGNLAQRWGRYSPEEITYLVWMGVIAGAYVTHGETYTDGSKNDIIFWADGGELKGESWKRIAFLRKIVEECPNPPQLADVSRDDRTSTAGEGYYIIYFGKEMNEYWIFNLPNKNASYPNPKPGTKYKVEIIDAWDMTIKEYPGIFETGKVLDYRLFDKDLKKIRLPLKPYIALRVTEIKK